MSGALHFHYDFIPREILDPETSARRIELMKLAGVETIWLDTYAYGNVLATKEQTLAAKQLLESHGFCVQALTVPVGHGGAALSGEVGDPGVPAHWQLRVNHEGQPVPFTSCVRCDAMIKESRTVAEELYGMGFTQLFYDDDLRVGPWGQALQGCCCDACMKAFYTKYPQYAHLTAPEIFATAAEGDDLWNAWSDAQCDAVTAFIKKTVPDGMTPGIMVMHNGDCRHGVDIARIKAAFPNVLVRVGEAHFEDASFTAPHAEQVITRSIKSHLHLVGNVQNAFSESTVYPENALSPENLVQKLRIEIRAGLRNLYLMSGFFFLAEPYWQAIADARAELDALAESTPVPDPTWDAGEFIWHI